jgi:protein-tyrosine phosphatase
MTNHINYERIYNDLITPFHPIIKIGSNYLYLGNQSAAGGVPDPWNYTSSELNDIFIKLKNNNIKAIVCCADNVEIYPNDFKYQQIPMNNNNKFDIEYSIKKAYDFIIENIKKGSVFIHCNAGVTRSASTVIYFLMKYNKWNYETAYNYLYNIRSCIDVELFKSQLKKFE